MKALQALVYGTALTAGIASADSIDDLGSNDFPTRDKAHAAFLAKADDPATIEQLEKAAKHRDFEIARRAELLLRGHRDRQITQAIARIKEHFQSKLPWHDMIPPDKTALGEGYARSGGVQDGWKGYRDATEAMVENMLRAGETEQTVMGLMEEMRRNELKWIEQHGNRMVPPVYPTWPAQVSAK